MYRYFARYKGRLGNLAFTNKEILDTYFSDLIIRNLEALDLASETKYENRYKREIDRCFDTEIVKVKMKEVHE